MLSDLPFDQLRQYQGQSDEPDDFDQFWSDTLDQTASAAWPARLEPIDHPFANLEIYDVTFAGWAGTPVKGWLQVPAGGLRTGGLPGLLRYHGYGGGRGFAFGDLMWAEAGHAALSVDNRGQGAAYGGGTPDAAAQPTGPQVPGWMTVGIDSPETYYYRRLIADCVGAFDALASLDGIDPGRIGVIGASQGALLSLAVAALRPVAAAALRVPFLCDPRRAVEVTDQLPYRELTDYLAARPGAADQVFRTLSYVDGVNFARRAGAAAHISLGLMDQISPPSTVFAMFNHDAGPKRLQIGPNNGHEGGGVQDDLSALDLFGERLSLTS
jgi:cephalosporin-C deacetylase